SISLENEENLPTIKRIVSGVHSTPDTMRFSYLKDFLLNLFMLNENQTRKLAAGCSKQCFEVADGN
ncbi:TPA: hypothetical protein ACL44M_001848, partial [Streptococcus pneumoniae]